MSSSGLAPCSSSIFQAPTNNAFAKLPQELIDFLLLPENVQTLTDILLYHVVDGSYLSPSLSTGEFETLQSESIDVQIFSTGVRVNDANVITPDILATNGVIHVIDSVLIPDDVELPTFTDAPVASPAEEEQVDEPEPTPPALPPVDEVFSISASDTREEPSSDTREEPSKACCIKSLAMLLS